MRRLVCDFASRTNLIVGNLISRLICSVLCTDILVKTLLYFKFMGAHSEFIKTPRLISATKLLIFFHIKILIIRAYICSQCIAFRYIFSIICMNSFFPNYSKFNHKSI